MFSLIITIISIALVTALALATIYYGGSAFRQGGDAAAAAKLINEGQQLSGAAAITEANSGTVSTQAALVTGKALQSPISSYLDAADTVNRAFTSKTTTDVPAAICAAVNTKAGIATPTTIASIGNYGCVQATNLVPGQMVFKY